MALAVNITVSDFEREIISAKSWNINPMGAACSFLTLTIKSSAFVSNPPLISSSNLITLSSTVWPESAEPPITWTGYDIPPSKTPEPEIVSFLWGSR